MKTKTKIALGVVSVLALAGVFVLGTYFGYQKRPFVERVAGVSNQQVPEGTTADFESFWKVWNIIDEKYPNAGDVSAQDRIYGAIQGLVASIGDPYSVYFPPKDAEEFEETINGSFSGIGMEVGIKDKLLTVIAPLKNTPAERAGIKAGDVVLKIDDTPTTDMSVDKAVSLIRGEKGTTIRLSIYREGMDKANELTITRDTIEIPILETQKRADGVYVIELYNFGASASKKFSEALIDFKNSGSTKLVIDLRNNPGGYLDAAVYMASFFLPEGEVVVREDFGKNAEEKVYRSRGFDLIDTSKVKIVMLVDKGSASASEIVAGALSEYGVATLIGETTYGKGSVQELVDVTENTTVKITIAKWLTPKGVSISEKGLEPDIKVETTEEDIKNEKDPTLDRAIQFFNTGR